MKFVCLVFALLFSIAPLTSARAQSFSALDDQYSELKSKVEVNLECQIQAAAYADAHAGEKFSDFAFTFEVEANTSFVNSLFVRSKTDLSPFISHLLTVKAAHQLLMNRFIAYSSITDAEVATFQDPLKMQNSVCKKVHAQGIANQALKLNQVKATLLSAPIPVRTKQDKSDLWKASEQLISISLFTGLKLDEAQADKIIGLISNAEDFSRSQNVSKP